MICWTCDYYDSSVDACNADDKCYMEGCMEGYQQGRADAINEVIRLINSKHATINYSEQTDIHTITIFQRDTKWLKEQLKEQK